ncbi:Uncharacterised protein [Porphyromonas macacae]|uniref:Uncharacterized protein n=1 Tax=Porphyromonas macacae TaxID=28115 RepID=A0A379EBC8_9PORP|nr:Uncharacterised protein [Porphyromonas macacae]
MLNGYPCRVLNLVFMPKEHLASDSVIDRYYPQVPATELDRWAIDSFKPTNIQTLYRWQKSIYPQAVLAFLLKPNR